MRAYTDKFFEAWQAGAKPIALAYLNIDDTLYCFGKQTPLEAWLQASTFFWEARVLTFGTFTQELSTDSSDVFQTLTEKPMDSYSVTFDNADGYFSLLAAQHNLLAGTLSLYLGYEYPGFAAADFRRLFFGKISTLKWQRQTAVITAQQAMTPIEPESPAVDTTTTYSVSIEGNGGISGSFPFSAIDSNIYSYEDGTLFIYITYDVLSYGAEEILFAIKNDTTTVDRFLIGFDADGHPFVEICSDVTAISPTKKRFPANFIPHIGQNHITMILNNNTGEITFEDSDGNSEGISTEALSFIAVTNTTGTGDGQVRRPAGIKQDANGRILVCDAVNDRVQILEQDGTFFSKFGSFGTGNGQFSRPTCIDIGLSDNIYVSDRFNNRIQQFTSAGVYVGQWGSSGAGAGQFSGPAGIAIDYLGNLFVVDSGNNRVQKFDYDGTFILQFGSLYLTDPAGCCLDATGSLFVADYNGHRVVKFSSGGVPLMYFTQFDSLEYPQDVIVDSNGNIFITYYDENSVTDGIKVFNTEGDFLYTFGGNGTGNGKFNDPQGICLLSDGSFRISDTYNNRIQKLDTLSANSYDKQDNGTDSLVFSHDFNGSFISARINDNILYPPLINTTPILEDIISGLDLTVDGVITPYGTLDTMPTIPPPETPLTGFEGFGGGLAGGYPNCLESHQNLFLPLPYGNLQENSAGGAVYVAPCIDSLTFVYCVAGFPIQSVSDGNDIDVFVDGVLTPSGWTFDEDNDYLSQGHIATLTFSGDPGGEVTVAPKSGPADIAGVSLTNPVDILEHLLEFIADSLGASTWTKDDESFAQVRALSTRLLYTCAGVIQASQPINYWVQAILKGFLGWYTFNADGLLEIGMTDISANNPQTFATLNEYDAISASATQDDQSLCNALTINYAIAYTKIDRRYKNAGDPSYYVTEEVESITQSAAIYGTHQKDLNFDWTRNTYTVQRVAEYLLAQYNAPEIFIEYEGQDFLAAPLELRDYVKAAWSFVLDQDGESSEETWELRSKNLDLDNFTNRLTLKKNKTDIPALYDFVYIGEDRVYIGDDPVAILR